MSRWDFVWLDSDASAGWAVGQSQGKGLLEGGDTDGAGTVGAKRANAAPPG